MQRKHKSECDALRCEMAALESDLTQQRALYEENKLTWQQQHDTILAEKLHAEHNNFGQLKQAEKRTRDLQKQLDERNARVADLERKIAWILGENDAILEARDQFTQSQAVVIARHEIEENETLIKKRAEKLVAEARADAHQQITQVKEACNSDLALLREEVQLPQKQLAESQTQTQQDLALALAEGTKVAAEATNLRTQMAAEVY